MLLIVTDTSDEERGEYTLNRMSCFLTILSLRLISKYNCVGFCLTVVRQFKYVFSENGLVAHKDGSLIHEGVSTHQSSVA